MDILLVTNRSAALLSDMTLLRSQFAITTISHARVLAVMNSHHFSAILLDSTGDIDQAILSLVDLRRQQVCTPILMMLEEKNRADIVTALDAGADACLCIPFDPRELLARLRQLTAQRNSSDPDTIYFGDLQLNIKKKQIISINIERTLSTRESKLLRYLMENPEKRHSLKALCLCISGSNSILQQAHFFFIILSLKRKLSDISKETRLFIHTGITFSLNLKM